MFREKRLSHWALTAIANWTTFAPNKVVSFVCGQLV
jgi:hypothetical protein